MQRTIDKLYDEGFVRCVGDRYMSECRLHMAHDYIHGYDPFRTDVSFKGILDNDALLKILSNIEVLFIHFNNDNDDCVIEMGDGKSMYWNREYQFTVDVENLINALKAREFFGVTYIILVDGHKELYTLLRKNG